MDGEGLHRAGDAKLITESRRHQAPDKCRNQGKNEEILKKLAAVHQFPLPGFPFSWLPYKSFLSSPCLRG